MEENAFDLTAKLNYKPRLLARIKWWFTKRKYIKERAKRGWSSYDVWSFNAYLAQMIGGALDYLANQHLSHPADLTEEEWENKLRTIAECFKQYTIEHESPAYQAYCAATERVENEDGSIVAIAPEELCRAWLEEDRRNYEEKMRKLKEGFDLLYEVYPNLWD